MNIIKYINDVVEDETPPMYGKRFATKDQFCINHPDKKVYAKRMCRSCYIKDLYIRNPEFKQSTVDKAKEYRFDNLDKIHNYDKQRWPIRSAEEEYREQRKNNWYKRKYKITLDDVRFILNFQNNKCAICEFPLKEGDRFMHLDHDHNTNEVRGLLCSQCNWFMSKIDKVKNCQDNLNNYIKYNGVKWKKQKDIIKEN